MQPKELSFTNRRSLPLRLLVVTLLVASLPAHASDAPPLQPLPTKPAKPTGLPKVPGTNANDEINETFQMGNGQVRQTSTVAEDITGVNGNDQIWGYEANDFINAGGGEDAVDGGGGNDVIEGSGDNDILSGVDGEDYLAGDQGNDKLFGGQGNDVLNGGPHFDFLDGQEGADYLFGETNEDCVVGRDANDTLVGGPGDDFFVILGNSVTGYRIEGGQPNGDDGSFTDLLFFARDVNQDNFMVKSAPNKQTGGTYNFGELEYGLRTDQSVTLNIPAGIAAGTLRNIEVVVTGDGNDVLTGTDRNSGAYAYATRLNALHGPGVHGIQVHEMFITSGGNDTVTTGLGDDLVDAGAGNDTIIGRNGALNVTTGEGADVLRFTVADLAGAKVSIVTDLTSNDHIEVLGSSVNVADFTFIGKSTNGVTGTVVKYQNRDKFDLRGVQVRTAKATAISGGVRITGTPVAVGNGGNGVNPIVSPPANTR